MPLATRSRLEDVMPISAAVGYMAPPEVREASAAYEAALAANNAAAIALTEARQRVEQAADADHHAAVAAAEVRKAVPKAKQPAAEQEAAEALRAANATEVVAHERQRAYVQAVFNHLDAFATAVEDEARGVATEAITALDGAEGALKRLADLSRLRAALGDGTDLRGRAVSFQPERVRRQRDRSPLSKIVLLQLEQLREEAQAPLIPPPPIRRADQEAARR